VKIGRVDEVRMNCAGSKMLALAFEEGKSNEEF
jgi:hypothetical protein